METLTLADNLVHVNTVLNTRYPGGWKNVRAQHIKTEKSMALPIYANTRKSLYVIYMYRRYFREGSYESSSKTEMLFK